MNVIASHAPLDFDGLACLVAAHRLHPDAVPIAGSDLSPQVASFLELAREEFGIKEPEEIEKRSVRKVILVDTQHPERVEGLTPLLSERVEWHCYDHHPPDPRLNFSGGEIRAVGAATTILVRKLEQKDLAIHPFEATLFAIGIYHDTGDLTHPSTQPEDARCVAFLLERGADLNRVSEYSRLSPPQGELLKKLQATVSLERLDEKIILSCFSEEGGKGAADAVDHLSALFGADVTLAAIESEGETLVIGRAKDFDVRALLSPVCGKGHPGAASGRTKMRPKEAIELLKSRVSSFLPPPLQASGIMNSPVRAVETSVSASSALERLILFGHGALAMTEEGKAVGMITRKELEKAVRHGLAEEAVGEIGDRRLFSLKPDASLSEILSLMGKQNIGRVLVLEESRKPLGIITRSDVIWALEAHPRQKNGADLLSALEALWPPEALALLRAAGTMAEGAPIYLVGGAVRDLLLGRPNLDIDLVFEGDAIGLANKWARHSGYTSKPHPPFCTALLTGGSFEVDLAMAREEYYAHPNALPVVEPASIRQDLFRRDFTINAMALDLSPGKLGKLLDPFGGREDLEKKSLRVLHRLSFIEDPTRILRGIRFSVRLGFRFDEHSEDLARYASSRLGAIGGERLKRELRKLLEDGDPQGIRLLFRLEANQLIADSLKSPDPKLWRRYHRLKKLFSRNLEGSYWLSGLALLFEGLPLEEVHQASERLLLGENERKILFACLKTKEIGNFPESKSGLYFCLKPCCPEALLSLAATLDRKPRHRVLDFAFRLRGVALEGGLGYTLKELGLPSGPAYREILDAVLAAKLDGLIEGAEQELSLARDLASPKRPE